jgi:3-oxoadipate enol-lactonase
VSRIRLHWERGGDPEGPRVLFINGTGGDLRAEPSVFTWPIANGFDLLAYDPRGLGRSDKPDVDYTMLDYAEDAVGLLDEVGWDRCAVLGISFGGMVAQELALLAPERVERLVLCCTSSGGGGGASYPLQDLEALADDERAARALELSDTSFTAEWQARHPQIVELYRSRAQHGADDPHKAMGARRQLEARARHDTYDRLPALTMPTLVCAGRRDGIAPLANSEAIAAQIPGAELAVFDGGHLILMQDPAAWRRITAFLRAA